MQSSKMDALMFLTASAHLIYTPFTKVEESFNLQAMHDILYLRNNFSQYDHHDFPGVVPRTFIGPLFIAILSAPFVMLFEALKINKFWAQYVVRFILAAIITAAWTNLRKVITKLYGPEVRLWYTVITLSQFHFLFYMSRPLPNVFALPIVLLAVSYWLQNQTKHFIVCSGIAVLIFRSELLIFLGLLLLFDLVQRKITIDRLLKIALPAGVAILAATVLVDSFFWQRLLWPEGEVLWYNTILNRSANWGTSPFFWYFYSALPRALGGSLLFIPFGICWEPRIRPLVFAALGFVVIYSILPHKELRFIIYVFPVLNLAVACACHRIWINRAKSVWHTLFALCAAGHLFLNLLITIFLLIVSGTNYPGGVAMSRLHRLESTTPNVSVHIANLAAQSGVSRFMEIRADWHYSKTENLNYTRTEMENYTHLLVEAKSKQNAQLWAALQVDFETVEFVECFNSIAVQYNSLIPMRIKTKPCIGILKKRKKTSSKAKESETTKGIKKDKALSTKKLKDNKKKEKAIPEAKLSANPEIIETMKVKEMETTEDNEDGIVSNVELADENDDGIVSNVETVDENDDGIVTNVDDDHTIEITESLEDAPNKEINFQELRNLALGEANRKTKATKLKIRKIIEQHYRAKGRQIENDTQAGRPHTAPAVVGTRQSVKAIIKQERIKEMIEQIATMDLTRICNLEKISTKDCLKQVIDKIDESDER